MTTKFDGSKAVFSFTPEMDSRPGVITRQRRRQAERLGRKGPAPYTKPGLNRKQRRSR